MAPPRSCSSRPASLAALLVTMLHASGCMGSATDQSGVRITPVRDLPGYSIPFGESPWSPRGLRLVVRGAEGLAIYDASRPDVDPRPLVSAGTWVHWYGWSPDGEWLLTLQSGWRPRSTRSLVAFSVSGADTVVLARDLEDAWPVTWAPDGQIAFGAEGRIHWLAPPASWSPVDPSLLERRPVLVAGPQWFDPGDTLARSYKSPFPGSSHDLITDAQSGASRWLLRGIPGDPAPAVVIDGNGAVVADLRGLPFVPSSVSSDGSLILGHVTRDDGHAILEAHLWLGEVRGRSPIQLESSTPGHQPRFAREGLLFAYEDPFGSGVHVAELVRLP